MTHGYNLSLVRVECLNEQLMEWGKDEMHFLAYGVSRRGTPYATGYRSIGSYGTGDVRTTSPLPMTLFEGELPSDGLDNLLLLWIVEQDSGGVRDKAAELDAQFLADFAKESAHLTEVGFPRECIPFTAFYKAATPLDARINQAATKRRNDEVYSPPVDLFFTTSPPDPRPSRRPSSAASAGRRSWATTTSSCAPPGPRSRRSWARTRRRANPRPTRRPRR